MSNSSSWNPNEAPLEREKESPRAAQRLVDVQAAAMYLAVSVSTLYGWVWQRRIPFVKIGRALRFDLADLESFIAVNKTSTRRNPRASAGIAAW
jgi:excisionase family DNA binding protein